MNFRDEKDKNGLEKMKKELYSRTYPDIINLKRTRVVEHDPEVSKDWQTEAVPIVNVKRQDRLSLPVKVLIFSIIFLLISISYGLYVWFGGSNMIFTKNVDISVLGPVSIGAGEDLSLDVVVSNKNNAELEYANLSIEYPDGTKVAGDTTKALKRDTFSYGNIKASGEGRQNFKSAIFGDKDSTQTIKFDFEYRVKGSNSIFSKTSEYQITISSSPVIMNITAPSEVNSGQDISFDIDLSSNTNTSVPNFTFVANYPFGFTYKGASIKPNYDNNVWSFGDLPSNSKKHLKIYGRLDGQDADERIFRFVAGSANGNDGRIVDSELASESPSVTIAKPFIALNASVNSDSSDTAISSIGANNNVSINWKNNLPTSISNLSVTVNIVSPLLDRESVTPGDGGFWRSIDNVIVWDKNSKNTLTSLDPGVSDSATFNFNSFDVNSGVFSSLRNPEIDFSINVSGTRINDSGKPEVISTSITKKIRMATSVGLSARMVRTGSSINNTGSIPPRAEKASTYTVIWTATNSYNDAKSVVVQATLPTYVSWTNNVYSSTGEDIVYDDSTRTITWTVGNLLNGSGFNNPAREVQFQISFLPSVNQIGSAPDLIGGATLTGIDSFTNKNLGVTKTALGTKISSDPSFKIGDEVVGR